MSRSMITFCVNRNGGLVRSVKFKRGQPHKDYSQECTLAILQDVTELVAKRGDTGTTVHDLWRELPDNPRTQLAIALQFIKERGLVEIEKRRSYPVSNTLFEDVMIEYLTLKDGE